MASAVAWSSNLQRKAARHWVLFVVVDTGNGVRGESSAHWRAFLVSPHYQARRGMKVKIARGVVWILTITVGVINLVVGLIEHEADTLSIGICSLLVLALIDHFLVKLRNKSRDTELNIKTEKTTTSKRERRKLIRKARYEKLEARTSWRLIKVGYGIAALILALSVLLSVDEYEDGNTEGMFFIIVLAVILYPIFKRLMAYIYFGKVTKQEEASDNQDKVYIVDAVIKDGKSILPSNVAENTVLAGAKLNIHPVEKLAYQFEVERFRKVCAKYDIDQRHGNVLLELIHLNSGYITPSLIQLHLPYSHKKCLELSKELIAARQAVKSPADRELYLLSNEKRITR